MIIPQTDQQAIEILFQRGHFWGPSNPEGNTIKHQDLHKLTLTDAPVIAGFKSFSRMGEDSYQISVTGAHGETAVAAHDGIYGPAMKMYMSIERCAVPDNPPPPGAQFAFENPWLQETCEIMQAQAAQPARGPGNWPGCWDVGDFHSVSCQIDERGMADFLKPVWIDVLRNMRIANAGIGLLYHFIDRSGNDIFTGKRWTGGINTRWSFVQTSPGWIGLAIVSLRETCSGEIWARYKATFRGGNTAEEVAYSWWALTTHEGGHNQGLQHTSQSAGGVMGPTIDQRPKEQIWRPDDPSTRILQRLYGGVPVPIPGDDPDIPNPPPTDIEGRLSAIKTRQHKQAVQLAVMETKLQYIIDEVIGK